MSTTTLSATPQHSRAQKLRADLILFGCAAIWGSGFVFQKKASLSMDPLSYNAARFLIAAAVMYGAYNFIRRMKTSRGKTIAPPRGRWQDAIISGVLLFVAINTQQIGITTSSVGKAGFITGLYVVLVPIIGVFIAHRISALQVISVAIAATGLYFLSVTSGFTITFGDTALLINACMWALYILYVDIISKRNDTILFAARQYFVCALVSLAGGLMYNAAGGAFVGKSLADALSALLAQVSDARGSLLYNGLASTCVGFSLQIYAQQHAPPTHVSVIISLEAVFAMFFGFMMLREIPTGRELFGASLMFSAIILGQLFPPKPHVPRAKKAAKKAENKDGG